MTSTDENVKSEKRNCVRYSEKYFLYNPIDLFTYTTLWPNQEQSIGSKFNSIFRMTILIFLLLLIMSYKYCYIFLLLAFIINILFYFMWKKNYD